MFGGHIAAGEIVGHHVVNIHLGDEPIHTGERDTGLQQLVIVFDIGFRVSRRDNHAVNSLLPEHVEVLNLRAGLTGSSGNENTVAGVRRNALDTLDVRGHVCAR